MLSMGRRCVLLGYAFYWPPWSLSAYFIHPVTGCRIKLRVEDYCPYLDEVWYNPRIGNFDNVLSSSLLLFEMTTAEMWPDVLHILEDAAPNPS